MTVLTRRPDPLNATDRCDRCGAQAYVRAYPVTGGELLFCVHHNKEHRPALEANGAIFYDECAKIEQLAGSPASGRG